MRIDVLTLFPDMFAGPFDASIIKRARAAGIVRIHVWDLRDFTVDRHRTADDVPYGGGAGMVMKPEPIFAAVEHVQSVGDEAPPRVILLSPQGMPLRQALVRELAQAPWLILLCGHYEGVDERVKALVTDEVSIGDYVLTGGELPAMVLVDAVVRLLPGAVGEAASVEEESFAEGLLEYPHYTRPAVFRGMSVPDVLLSGHHQRIRLWRRKEALRRTWERRLDLLARAALTAEDRRLLLEVVSESWAGHGPAPEGG